MVLFSIFAFALIYFETAEVYFWVYATGYFVASCKSTPDFPSLIYPYSCIPFSDWTEAMTTQGMKCGKHCSKYQIYLKCFFFFWYKWYKGVMDKNQNMYKCLSGGLRVWCAEQTGRRVKGWGAWTKHGNAVTRETACDSQGLILLIAQSYLITVWLQGILCSNWNIFLPRNKQKKKGYNCIISSAQVSFWILFGCE